MLGLYGCSTSSSSSSPDGGGDDSGSPDAGCDTSYHCGNACVPGNSIGVGHFCDHITDCLETSQAHLCATLGDSTEHFCTFVCHDPDAGADGDADAAPVPTNECGENASCQCQGGQCGCFPDICK
jgi:hypothetical protein